MSSSVVASKAWREPGFLKKQRACFSNTEILIMGVLDAVSSVLSCVGGSGTAGGVQNVINQTLIPVTLLMSRFWLGARCRSGAPKTDGSRRRRGFYVDVSWSGDAAAAT